MSQSISIAGHKPPRAELLDVLAALDRNLRNRGLRTTTYGEYGRRRQPNTKPRRFTAR